MVGASGEREDKTISDGRVCFELMGVLREGVGGAGRRQYV